MAPAHCASWTATEPTAPTAPWTFWPMLFDNLTIRLLGSDDFPIEAKRQAAADLTAGALSIPFADPYPLEQAAAAHERVDTDNRARILLTIPD